MIELHKRGSKEISDIIEDFKVTVEFLYSDDILKRKIGYALSLPKFESLSQELKKLIHDLWFQEPKKHKLSKKFVEICDKVFVAE